MINKAWYKNGEYTIRTENNGFVYDESGTYLYSLSLYEIDEKWMDNNCEIIAVSKLPKNILAGLDQEGQKNV